MSFPKVHSPMEKATKGLAFLEYFIFNPNIEVGDYTYFDGQNRSEKFENSNVVFCTML